MKSELLDVVYCSPKLYFIYNNFKVLDRKKYKGKGRPRKSDYVLLKDWKE